MIARLCLSIRCYGLFSPGSNEDPRERTAYNHLPFNLDSEEAPWKLLGLAIPGQFPGGGRTSVEEHTPRGVPRGMEGGGDGKEGVEVTARDLDIHQMPRCSTSVHHPVYSGGYKYLVLLNKVKTSLATRALCRAGRNISK